MSNLVTECLYKIKNAIYGKDVRNSIHDAIEYMNNETNKNTTKQNRLERLYTEQIQNIAASEPQSAEIVDARAGFSTLGNVIKQKIYHFDCVEDMKNCLSLVPGDVCQTLGYYVPNDNGGATYKIVDNSQLLEDGGKVHVLGNGLKAELNINNSRLNLKQFGAYGDGVHDDTLYFQNAINTATKSKYKYLFIDAGNYIINSTIQITDQIEIEGASRKSVILNLGAKNACLDFHNETTDQIYEVICKNITILGADIADFGIKITKASQCRFEKIYIERCRISNFKYINSSINYFIDCYSFHSSTAFYAENNGFTIIKHANFWQNDICFELVTKCNDLIIESSWFERFSEFCNVDNIENEVALLRFNSCYILQSDINKPDGIIVNEKNESSCRLRLSFFQTTFVFPFIANNGSLFNVVANNNKKIEIKCINSNVVSSKVGALINDARVVNRTNSIVSFSNSNIPFELLSDNHTVIEGFNVNYSGQQICHNSFVLPTRPCLSDAEAPVGTMYYNPYLNQLQIKNSENGFRQVPFRSLNAYLNRSTANNLNTLVTDFNNLLEKLDSSGILTLNN